MSAPSGVQTEIAAGEQRAVVVEVGGGLRSYRVGDADLLDGYGPAEMSTSGRGQVLMPWPNRLEGGSYEFRGRRHQLPLDEPEARNAIHGVSSKMKAIKLIQDGHVERGSGGAFFTITVHMEILMVSAFVSESMHQRWVAVECKYHRLIGRED